MAPAPTRVRLHVGLAQDPPPAIAGAFAAWLVQQGSSFEVVDALEGPDLWVVVDQPVAPGVIPDGARVFGPMAEALGGIVGDPSGVHALEDLPITTWAGFGLPHGGARRILAGRGDRVRPVAQVLREITYLVEMQQVGHLFFDDADLAAYGEWLRTFEAELARLPWDVTWDGTVDGARRSG